jgi:hypothetical protein
MPDCHEPSADVAVSAAELRRGLIGLLNELCETAHALHRRWQSGTVPECYRDDFRSFLDQVTAVGNALVPLVDALHGVVCGNSPALGLQPLVDHRGPEGRLERFAALLRENTKLQADAVASLAGLERRLQETVGRGLTLDQVSGVSDLLLLTIGALRFGHAATAEPLTRLLAVVDTLRDESPPAEDPR